MKKILLVLAFIGATFTQAHAFERVEPGRAVLSGFVSKHLSGEYMDKARGYNEDNYGVGFRSETGYTIGIYKNSIHKDSVYIGREFQWKLYGPLHAGVVVGAVSGYGDVMPILLPELIIKTKIVEVGMTIIPRVPHVDAAIALQLRLRF